MKLLLAAALLFPLTAGADLASILAPIEPKAPSTAATEPKASERGTAARSAAPQQVSISRDELHAALTHLLYRHLDLEGDLSLRFLASVPELTVSSPAWQLTFASYPDPPLSSRMVFDLRIEEPGAPGHSFRIPVACQLFREVLVAAENLPRGDAPLSQLALEVEPRDMLARRDDLVAATIDTSAFVLNAAVRRGDALRQRHISPRPLVRKNDVVEVIASVGALSITAKGVALQDGLSGEFIDVRNLSSRKVFQAQVIDESTLRVHF